MSRDMARQKPTTWLIMLDSTGRWCCEGSFFTKSVTRFLYRPRFEWRRNRSPFVNTGTLAGSMEVRPPAWRITYCLHSSPTNSPRRSRLACSRALSAASSSFVVFEDHRAELLCGRYVKPKMREGDMLSSRLDQHEEYVSLYSTANIGDSFVSVRVIANAPTRKNNYVYVLCMYARIGQRCWLGSLKDIPFCTLSNRYVTKEFLLFYIR